MLIVGGGGGSVGIVNGCREARKEQNIERTLMERQGGEIRTSEL